MRRISALALAAAACSSPTIGPSFDLKTPVSMAAFAGYTRYDAFLHTYVAVASMQGDELRVFDPLENRAVSSPGFAFPLSVPTDRRPVLLASASLNDVDAPLPDLLVVASAGEQKLQVVDTWEGPESSSSGAMYVLATPPPIDLSPVADPGTQVLAMIGLPSFQPGTTQIAPGRARILLAFSKPAGGSTAKLVTVEFQRGAGGSIDAQAASATLRSVTIGFEALSLARVVENTVVLGAPAAPKYPHLVFAATPDIVTGTDGRSATGVAMLDASGSDPSTWTVTAVDARAPTRLVAAAVVGERYPDLARANTTGPVYRAFASPALRVYAAIDPSACGPAQPIGCGIVTLDPLAASPGIAAEIIASGTSGPIFVPFQTFRAPMSLPGVALAMAVALPPSTGSERCDPVTSMGGIYDVPCGGGLFTYRTDDVAQPLMRLSPFSGQYWTTGALVVASSTGSSYVLDIGSSAAPDDVSLLVGDSTRVQATKSLVVVPAGSTLPNPPTQQNPVLGLWDSQGTPADTSFDPGVIDRSILVTPGFTVDDDWAIAWQGVLPGFELRPAVVGRKNGAVYVALQTPKVDANNNTVGWFSDTDLGDPVLAGPLGIHALDPVNATLEPGDIVEVYDLNGNSLCLDPNGVPIPQNTRVLGFLSPVPALPLADPASIPGGALSLGSTVPTCIDPGPADGQYYRALATVRSFALVLKGTLTGYAGRPTLDSAGPSSKVSPSALAWDDERPLSAACAGGSRAACERLAIVRKARRFYYPMEPPCPLDNTSCYTPTALADPLVPGPALAFRVGPSPASAPAANIVRGTAVSFSTLSGVAPMARLPAVVSIPTAAIAVDRTVPPLNASLMTHPDEGAWFYVSYAGNTVMGFGPGLFAGTAVSLR